MAFAAGRSGRSKKRPKLRPISESTPLVMPQWTRNDDPEAIPSVYKKYQQAFKWALFFSLVSLVIIVLIGAMVLLLGELEYNLRNGGNSTNATTGNATDTHPEGDSSAEDEVTFTPTPRVPSSAGELSTVATPTPSSPINPSPSPGRSRGQNNIPRRRGGGARSPSTNENAAFG